MKNKTIKIFVNKTDEGKIINNYPGFGIEYQIMMSRPNYTDFNYSNN